MSNITSLSQRIDKLLARIDRTLPAKKGTLFDIPMCFFADSEQVELQLFADQIEPKLAIKKNGQVDLDQLTDQELDTLELWVRLETSLAHECIEDAAKYRRYLSWSQEQLIKMFLAIDESGIPDEEHAPRIAGQKLYRLKFRADRARIEERIANNQFAAYDLDTMREWCSMYSPGIAA